VMKRIQQPCIVLTVPHACLLAKSWPHIRPRMISSHHKGHFRTRPISSNLILHFLTKSGGRRHRLGNFVNKWTQQQTNESAGS